MASAYEFAQYVNQLDVEAGNTPRYSDEALQKYKDGSDPNYINEDWYAASLRKNVLQSQQNLNVRGAARQSNIPYPDHIQMRMEYLNTLN